MDISDQENLWQAQLENLVMINPGVSGFGAKPSTKILSKDSYVIYMSKSQNGVYCKSNVP